MACAQPGGNLTDSGTFPGGESRPAQAFHAIAPNTIVYDIDASIDATPSLTVNGMVLPLAALGTTAPVCVAKADLLAAE